MDSYIGNDISFSFYLVRHYTLWLLSVLLSVLVHAFLTMFLPEFLFFEMNGINLILYQYQFDAKFHQFTNQAAMVRIIMCGQAILNITDFDIAPLYCPEKGRERSCKICIDQQHFFKEKSICISVFYRTNHCPSPHQILICHSLSERIIAYYPTKINVRFAPFRKFRRSRAGSIFPQRARKNLHL